MDLTMFHILIVRKRMKDTKSLYIHIYIYMLYTCIRVLTEKIVKNEITRTLTQHNQI